MTADLSQVPEFTLGWRLRMAMEFAGVKQDELADELDVSRATMSRWMHDDYKRPIKPIWLRAIALRCGVSYEWLRTGVVPPESTAPIRQYVGDRWPGTYRQVAA